MAIALKWDTQISTLSNGALLNELVPGTGLEPARITPADFRHTTAFTASFRCSCAGLCLDHGATRFRPPPSSLYTFSVETELRSALPRRYPGVSPNLTGFTRELSQLGAQLLTAKSAVFTNFTTLARADFSATF